ncbi:MAG: DUF4832 domain-containing protein [Candidatus Hydrogenedentes bacterium]|nr:DUF4832 domain-containing protein [Candidatus Hydrogenedentota bacterium]
MKNSMFLLFSLAALSSFALGEESSTQIIQYRGIRPTDPGGREGLRNPERGWRIETLIADRDAVEVKEPSSHLKHVMPPEFSDQYWILDAERYEPDGLTVAQTYCYLTNSLDTPISAEKLADLQKSLDDVRARGLKALLRFAYERDMSREKGPTLDTILGHMEQLAPVIQKNADIIYVLQAGFVGAWGEWHSSGKGLEQDHKALEAVVSKLLEILPNDRMTQVRVPKYKRWVLNDVPLDAYRVLTAENAHDGSPAARIGFHNDGFLAYNSCGGTWTEAPLFSQPGNPEFDFMTRESPFVPVDGELYWSDIGGKIDGLRAAIRMRLHHYTTFSIAHSYSEREGSMFSIDDWIKTPISSAQVLEATLPLSNGYFEDAQGNEVSRTQFEYIRDHLGYRIELQKAILPREIATANRLDVKIEFINRGFSTFHNPRPVFLVLIDDGRCAAEIPLRDVDPRTWQPYAPGDESYAPLTHTIQASLDLPQGLAPKWYMLGLWMPDASEAIRTNPNYAVRVANGNVPWWRDSKGHYGANVLGAVHVVK